MASSSSPSALALSSNVVPDSPGLRLSASSTGAPATTCREQATAATFPEVHLLGERRVFPAWMAATAGLVFLTFNSAMAIRQYSMEDEAMLAFLATSYVDVVLLSVCLWLYERVEDHGSPWSNRLKASVWTLTTLLTFSFGFVAMGTARLTLPVALHVWIIAAATGIGAFSAFFDLGRRRRIINQEMTSADPAPPV